MMNFLLGQKAYFQGLLLLVSGSVAFHGGGLLIPDQPYGGCVWGVVVLFFADVFFPQVPIFWRLLMRRFSAAASREYLHISEAK